MSANSGHPARVPPAGWAGRVRTALRILNVRLRFIGLMVVAGLLAGNWENLMNRLERWRRPAGTETPGRAATEYFCPMHPNIVRAEPSNCPACGMPLSKREATGPRALAEGVLAQVSLSPQKLRLGRIATEAVSYRLLAREIRTPGIVEYDETRRAFVSARFKGWLDHLMVNFVGQRVQKGEALARIYSPDLLIAQEELLAATRNAADRLTVGDQAREASSLIQAARRKLLLRGVTEEQIEEITRRGQAETHLALLSPIAGIVTAKNVLPGHFVAEGDDLYTIADLGRVWMQARIFEDEIGGIEMGTAVEVTSAAYPGESFAGRINFVSYEIDPATRTGSARVEIDNPHHKLRPGMYVRATIRLPVGRVEPASQASTKPVEGPATGPMARAYLDLAMALSRDETDADALTRLTAEAGRLSATAGPALKRQLEAVLRDAGKAAGKPLDGQREAFKALSGSMQALLRSHAPEGLTLYLQYCPMVEADWLADSERIDNPYHGSEMLRCGKVMEKLPPAGAVDEERYGVGYYCPILPDRLFAEPGECPVDQFPMRRVKLEKVLAVPEAAVIDTGTRKVVYRETSPGEFGMVEVRLGPRAGEYRPVLSGLRAGERVASAGAFLLDAENRLQPAAAVQYFGASGTPAAAEGK